MEKSSFFNSVNGDRKYQAQDFANFFNSFLTNGVFPKPSTNLQVLSNNNMGVTIVSGKAWINGYCYFNDSNLVLNSDIADGVLNRIDRIVIRMDTTGRAINATVKRGVYATTPIAPVLQRDANGFELGIADIYIGAGVTSITQQNITDLRLNTDLCGMVNSLIQVDTTTLFNQYQAWIIAITGQYNSDMTVKETDFSNQFNTWFANVKTQLGTDVAGNLQNQITTHITDASHVGGRIYMYKNIGGAF